MITVMTPTYNRAYILEKAYLSLKKQTCFDFEWIIIDDGSSDHTEQMAKKWIAECQDFSITYFKQPNGGKHRAINRGVKMARYDWFLILDSDDMLTESAVAKVHKWITEVSNLEGFAGIAGLKGHGRSVVGGQPLERYIDATNLERQKYGLLGDKAEVYKTEILKKYPFPEFEGENFIRESAVWDRIAKDGLKLRWYSEIIYLCEYIEDGLTRNTNAETYSKNFNGFTYCSRLFLETHSGILAMHKCGEFYDVAKRRNLGVQETAKILRVSQTYLQIGICVFALKKVVKGIVRKCKAAAGR